MQHDMTMLKKERDFYQSTVKRDESMSVYFTKSHRDRSTSSAGKGLLDKYNNLKQSQQTIPGTPIRSLIEAEDDFGKDLRSSHDFPSHMSKRSDGDNPTKSGHQMRRQMDSFVRVMNDSDSNISGEHSAIKVN